MAIMNVRAGLPELPWLLPAHLAGVSADERTRRSARDWVVDTIAFVLATAFYLHYGRLMMTGGEPIPDWVKGADLAVGALACASLWVRRRRPVAVALAMVPAGFFSLTFGAASLVALFTVTVHRRWSVALPVAALHAATVPPYFLYRPDPEMSYESAVTTILILQAAVVGWGMFVRARRQLLVSLRDRADRAEQDQQSRVQQARQTERTRIAREMHDVLAHRISLLSLHAGALEFRPDAPADEVAEAAGVIRASAHQALHDLREVIGVLRDEPGAAPDPPQPTLADVAALVEEGRAAGTRIRVSERVELPDTVPDVVGRTAYRVIQEALTNARKHAPAAAVDVGLTGGPGAGLTVTVANAAPVGAAAAIPGAGTGLIGLGERVQLAGGTLTSGPAADGGFRVRVSLPWPA
jgi:signal transduction histidine kinase